MQLKTTAALLVATALPFNELRAHAVQKSEEAVNGYLYLMLTIGAGYLLFLLVRMQRRKQGNNF